MSCMKVPVFLLLLGGVGILPCAFGAHYDLLLKGGHVIDPKNGIDEPRDVAVAHGKIAAVARDIPAGEALKVIDVTGLYVTPGLIDIHAHVYAGTARLTPACRASSRMASRSRPA